MKDELIRIAREAGAFFRRDELTDVVSKEGHANYVTNIDCRVQAEVTGHGYRSDADTEKYKEPFSLPSVKGSFLCKDGK